MSAYNTYLYTQSRCYSTREKTRSITGLVAALGLFLTSFSPAQDSLSSASAGTVSLSFARRTLSLNGRWQLTYGPIKSLDTLKQDSAQPPTYDTTIPATVPGDVLLDLVGAGLVKEPTIGKNVFDLLKYESYQWWYRRSFPTPPLNGVKADLVFDGVDCFGKVWVNGKLAGRTANMFIGHCFDVTSLLAPEGGTNEVLVRIDPATLAGREEHFPGEMYGPGHWTHLSVRKSGVRYGWDMAPRIVGAGLWQGVRLELTKPTHLRSTYWTTKVANVSEKGTASVIVGWDFATDRVDIFPMKIRVELSRNGKIALQKEFRTLDTHGQETIDGIKDLDYWWPRGFGEPALYDARVSLVDENGTVLDERKERVGIRTIQLVHTDTTSPQARGNFFFLVNGQQVFIKGANWGYLDVFPSREDKRVDKVVGLLAEMNSNMIRINGCGVYGSDRLYDLCDQNGILVWQDFMLHNARYPQTDEFRKVIAEEAASAISRLRNHPSLALWCGGNEVDHEYSVRDGLDPNKDTISREVLPQAVQRFDPYRVKAYLPSCPYLGPELIAKGFKYLPEVHLYSSVYFKAPFFTSDVIAPFASEIGRASLPGRASLTQMLDPDFVDPWTRDHQWNEEWSVKTPALFPWDDGRGGLNGIMNEIRTVFKDIPDKLDDLILASQATHAEALKFWIDSWRIKKGDRTGILFWSFMDGWPLISFGVVDYYDRKKLAYDYVQESQRDVQVICGEAEGGRHPVVVVNDTLAPVQGHVTVRRAGETVPVLEKDFAVGANGKETIGSIPQPEKPEMWQMEWKLQDGHQFKGHYLSTKGTVPLKDYLAWMKLLGIRTP